MKNSEQMKKVEEVIEGLSKALNLLGEADPAIDRDITDEQKIVEATPCISDVMEAIYILNRLEKVAEETDNEALGVYTEERWVRFVFSTLVLSSLNKDILGYLSECAKEEDKSVEVYEAMLNYLLRSISALEMGCLDTFFAVCKPIVDIDVIIYDLYNVMSCVVVAFEATREAPSI